MLAGFIDRQLLFGGSLSILAGNLCTVWPRLNDLIFRSFHRLFFVGGVWLEKFSVLNFESGGETRKTPRWN